MANKQVCASCLNFSVDKIVKSQDKLKPTWLKDTDYVREFVKSVTTFKNRPLIIKGCSKKNIPETVFLLAIEKLHPHVKSIFYGEACSSVPLFKKKND